MGSSSDQRPSTGGWLDSSASGSPLVLVRLGTPRVATQEQADALAERVAIAWSGSPNSVLDLLLPTTRLDQATKRRFHRRAALQEIVTADDWRELIRTRWQALALWREGDIASWLNGLIRERRKTQPDARRSPVAVEPALPTTREVAQTMFYIGR
jgi:hypothetical protein